MSKTAQGSVDGVDHVLVSEGTRQMSKPASHEVHTILQEYENLGKEIVKCEGKLTDLSQAAYFKEQNRIRRNGSTQKTLEEWLSRKAEMDQERHSITAAIATMRGRRMAIKDKAMEQKRAINNGPVDSFGVLQSILSELQAIRKHLEDRKEG